MLGRFVIVLLVVGCGRVGFDEDDLDGDLGPTLDLDFTRGEFTGLGVTRPTPATYVDAAGVLRVASANQPRFDHDPATLEPRGLLVEAASTNLAVRSTELESNRWYSDGLHAVTADVALAPDGTMTADEVADNERGGQSRRAKFADVSADDQRYAFSIFARSGTTSRFRFGAELLGGNPVQTSMIVDLGTASVVVAPTRATAFGVERYAAGWVRVWIAIENNATNDSALLSIWNDSGNNGATGTIYAWGGQVEPSASPSSFIPTTDAIVVRAADHVTATDLDWLDSERGTVRAIASLDTIGVTSQPILCLVAAATDRVCLARGSIGTSELVIASAGTPVTLEGGTWSQGSLRRLVATWQPGDAALWDESAGLATASVSIPDRLETVGVGTDNANALRGHIAALTYWPVRVSDDMLSDL